MAAADLDFRPDARLHDAAGIGHTLERRRRTDVRKPVVASAAVSAKLLLDRAGLEIVDHRHAFRQMARDVKDPLGAAVDDVRLIEPAEELRFGICASHPLHERSRAQIVHLPRLQAAAAPTRGGRTDRRIDKAEAGGRELAVRKVQESRQPRDLPKEIGERLFDVTARLGRRGAQQTAAEGVDGIRKHVGMLLDERIVRGEKARFDPEYPGADSVTVALLDRAAQLRQPLLRPFTARGERSFDNIAKLHRKPESVHAFVRKPVEIRLRIVVDVVGKFVAIERRTLDRRKIAARNALR